MAGTHDHATDQRNAAVLVNINGELMPRAEAKVSVFDSGFLMGDGVWEGLRLYNGRVPYLDAHLDRLFEGALGLHFHVPQRGEVGDSALAGNQGESAGDLSGFDVAIAEVGVDPSKSFAREANFFRSNSFHEGSPWGFQRTREAGRGELSQVAAVDRE